MPTVKVSRADVPPSAVYDPDQDPEERRELRKGYRTLTAKQDSRNVNDVTAEELTEDLGQANELWDHVKGTAEATLDSSFLLRTSNVAAAKARAMKAGAGAFDVDDFVARLITFMGGRSLNAGGDDDDEEYEDDGSQLDWERIGRRALAKSCRVPMTDFMLGPLGIEQKKRQVAKRSKLEKNKEDLKKPQEITEDDITRSENETTKNVAVILQLLTDQGGEVNLFRFVVNPHDFGQSVENLFYLSFLIRDGKCALQTNPKGEPVIMACEAPSESDYVNGLQKRQIVMEFDMATWKRAIEVFNITETIIPQRPKSQMRIGQKWYG